MSDVPTIVDRVEQPYLAASAFVTMESIGSRLPLLLSTVFDHLGSHGLAPAGPPFWRYVVIDMARQLEMQVGVPVAEASSTDASVDDEQLRAGVLPAGRYVTTVHTGHPSELMQATAELLSWAAQQDLSWDMTRAADGEHWGCRLEEYLTDPATQPDMSRWQTRLAFRLRD